MMENSIKVSIIMPSLNVGAYIAECIESVINQTLIDIEIICVDAGSTDGTFELLQSYKEKDNRIRLIRSDRKSYGYQMNLGLEAARGEYIGIVETDDFADLNMFERLYNIAVTNNAQVVKSNFYRYKSKKVHEDVYFENLKGLPYDRVIIPDFHSAIYRRSPSIWAGLYSRAFIEENNIRFSETPGAAYQDTGFNLKIHFCAERMIYVKEAFLHYRTDNENSSVKSGSKVFALCDEYKEFERFMQRYPEKEKLIAAAKNATKYETYRWNLQRIAYEYKYAFIVEMNKEFVLEKELGRLDKSYFLEHDWKTLMMIVDSPDAFFSSIPKPSFSYRISRAITYIPRHIKEMVKK